MSIGKEKAIVDEAVEEARPRRSAPKCRGGFGVPSRVREDFAAEPIIQAAEAALNSLDKKALGELKSLSTPPRALTTSRPRA